MSKEPNKRLFIGSLPFKFTEGELLSLFVPFGKIVALRIMHNRWGKSRGMGYVEFETLDEAIEAKQKMHNHQLEARSIIVDYSEPDPYLTPEGKARHEEALAKKTHKKKRFSSSFVPEAKTARPFFGKKPTHIRQTVFNSRFHSAKVGAKFASRTKKK
jgi:RNA recognition motif-containing protein